MEGRCIMSIFELGIEESKVFLEAANLKTDDFILPISLNTDGMILIAKKKDVIKDLTFTITIN